MYMELFLIAIGFIMLVKGADYLIKGSSYIAQRFGVSYFIIGLTIVAFGTSLPEFIVNMISALKGSTDIAVGNIIGSNMANILLIVGVTAMIMPLDVNRYAKTRDIPYALFSSVLLLVLASDVIILGGQTNIISRFDGIVLLIGFLLFLFFILRRSRDEILDEQVYEADYGFPKSLLFISAGVVALYIGGELIVDNAVALARNLSISEILISSTIVAFGTSLPELATSLIAAFKKNCDIAVGNIVGSNIFNILWVLGMSSIVTPIPIMDSLLLDMLLVIVATTVFLVMVHMGVESMIRRPKGMVLLALYIIYIAMLLIRG
ncbi:MAG TPA: calcium/sodium antiporter [Candidatus Methanofastidiosa archaeon]|nr:calcium/sodium antiporter [Candidatus Methanofastidiosa archaeon]